LLVSFDCLRSNWPFEPSFVLFCYNAMNYLGLEASAGERNTLHVGEPILTEGLSPETPVQVSGPGLAELTLRADAAGRLRVPATDRAGVYVLSPAGQPPMPFAVNVLDAAESDIAPAASIEVGGREIQGQTGSPPRGNVELWPLLTGLVLALVCVEWLVYNSKIRL
jgi:Ca-activated chloride channel homolog